jgi:hydrogenase-4 component E
MSRWTDSLFILVVMIDFFLLASSRLRAMIRAVATQGALLSLVALLLARGEAHVGHVIALSTGALVVKGAIIPWLLHWAISEAAIRREVEPIVGFVPSLIVGALGVGAAFAFASHLPLPTGKVHAYAYLVPTALSTIWTGLLLLVSRRKAVTQVIGFLVLENGIFVFGLLLSDFMPTMVEAGVLLDLLAAAFVMGIVIFDINREFSSIDTEKLSSLKD